MAPPEKRARKKEHRDAVVAAREAALRRRRNIRLGAAVGLVGVLVGLAMFNSGGDEPSNQAGGDATPAVTPEPDASDAVAAKAFTSMEWSPEDQANVDRAKDERSSAIIGYGIGGGLLVAAIVTLIVTEPKAETIVITPRRPTPTVVPAEGGAVLGGRWSF